MSSLITPYISLPDSNINTNIYLHSSFKFTILEKTLLECFTILYTSHCIILSPTQCIDKNNNNNNNTNITSEYVRNVLFTSLQCSNIPLRTIILQLCNTSDIEHILRCILVLYWYYQPNIIVNFYTLSNININPSILSDISNSSIPMMNTVYLIYLIIHIIKLYGLQFNKDMLKRIFYTIEIISKKGYSVALYSILLHC